MCYKIKLFVFSFVYFFKKINKLLSYYDWILIRYLYKEKEDIVIERTFVFWQQLPHLNFNSTNFFFTIDGSYKSHLSSIIINATNENRLEKFNDALDEKTFLPAIYENFNTETNFFEEFSYLRKSTFINFFVDNMIDVPICFKKSHSLKTRNFELPILKFSNFLMKKGKREKLICNLFKSMRLFYKSLKSEKIIANSDTFNWLNFYSFLTHYLIHFDRYDKTLFSFDCRTNILLKYEHLLTDFEKIINSDFFIKNYLLSRLSPTIPVFSYFIYSVDKNIRKFSRGKSGKYVFIWKYIASYKRLYLVMRWIVKDIKFYQSRKFSERLVKTFINLTLNPDKSFAWKSKIFSHNYVFKNFRKSLMSSLRTTL